MLRKGTVYAIAAWIAVGAALVALAVRSTVAGKLWGVHYDVLFWDAAGSGHVSATLALCCYVLGLAAAIAGIWSAVSRLHGWPWLLALGVATGLLSWFGSSAQPSPKDEAAIVVAGRRVVRALEQYKADHGGYPNSLSKLTPRYLATIPDSGLVRQRRFYYAKRGAKDDRGPWFNGAKSFVGKDPYAMAVPFVPRGTIVYRPSGDYRGIHGRPIGGGWALTSKD